MGIAHVGEWVDGRLGFTDPPPKSNLFVSTGGGYKPAVRREGGDELLAGGLAEGVEALAGSHMPELHGRIAAGTGQHGAVRAEGNAMHGAVMAFQRAEVFAGLTIPQLNALIIAGSGH